MIKAIAIDDEPMALEVVRNHAAKIPFLQLQEVFTDPLKAIDYLQQHSVDLIFLDIKMPDIDGIEFSGMVNGKKTMLIFTTAHSEYALQSYELNAIDYLLKPFDFARFLVAVTKARENLAKNPSPENDFFFVNTGHQQRRISFDEISHIEGDGNYVTYHLGDEKVIVRSTIKETLKLLPSSFIQIHRSFIIPIRKLERIQDNHAFIGKLRISIGLSYKEELMRRIEGKKM